MRERVSLENIDAATAERFWRKTDKRAGPSGCWTWTSHIDGAGYGRFTLRSRPTLAHRVAWRLRSGDDPREMLVCHRCDNRACVNPAHLFLGTFADNTQDMISKGRAACGRAVGEANPRAKLTEADVLAIRADSRKRSVIAKEYGIGETATRNVISGVSWAHVSGTALFLFLCALSPLIVEYTVGQPDPRQLASLKHLIAKASSEQAEMMREMGIEPFGGVGTRQPGPPPAHEAGPGTLSGE